MALTLHPELLEALTIHAGVEIGNAVFYLSAYSWARANGWEGFSKRWKNDAFDEFAHAQNFVKFIARYNVAINAEPKIRPMPEPELGQTLLGLAALAAALEGMTEESMRDLLRVAEGVGDGAAVEWISGKLLDQQKERKKADDFAARVQDAAVEPGCLVILDRKLERGGW